MKSFVGIDVGKGEFHATLLISDRTWSRSFSNNKAGLGQLASWLKNRKAEEIHACLESTGGFDEALAFDLHERGIVISVVNTSRIKSLAQSKFLRTKTDRVDAALIARFCWAPWLPPAPESPPCRPLWAATQAFKTCF